MKAVAAVLPFRVNNYVVDELIDWSRIPVDPMFQLTFPQPAMLNSADFGRMYSLIAGEASENAIQAEARHIQHTLNPHPAGQMDLNVPRLHGEPMRGVQHKYRETLLFFPEAGQTCHAYCTYCFRWGQFVGDDEYRFANRETASLVQYLKAHPEVTSVLLTGGDPMVMSRGRSSIDGDRSLSLKPSHSDTETSAVFALEKRSRIARRLSPRSWSWPTSAILSTCLSP